MIPYREILRMASQRINAVISTGTKNAVNLETAYMTSPLTATQIGNTDFTKSMLYDNLVAVIGRIIRTYAFVPNHPFRDTNISQTATIAHKGLIPAVDSAGKPIVGVYGAIRDTSDGETLTVQPEQIIKTIVTNADGFLKSSYYYFAQVGDRLYHTRPSVTMDVVTFTASDEFTSIGANGNAPIPDACLDIAWTGLAASLIIDDAFAAQANAYGQYFENCLREMATGSATFLPAPVLQSSQAPAIS